MIPGFARSLIKQKIKQLYYEQKMIMEDIEFSSIPRRTSDPPQVSYRYCLSNLALKLCELKICILEEIMGGDS